MEQLIRQIAEAIAAAFQQDDTDIDPNRRIRSSVIFKALRSTRNLVEESFEGPIRCRYTGYNVGDNDLCTQEGFKVLEYLVDFSFSRFSIPQAIGDPNAENIQDGGYQLVFAAESELGTPNEVCRDLLKLLDVRSSIRCLLFKRRVNQPSADRLKIRMLNVLRNHALSDDTMHGWLFIALDAQDDNVSCFFYTLDNELNDLVPIELEA